MIYDPIFVVNVCENWWHTPKRDSSVWGQLGEPEKMLQTGGKTQRRTARCSWSCSFRVATDRDVCWGKEQNKHRVRDNRRISTDEIRSRWAPVMATKSVWVLRSPETFGSSHQMHQKRGWLLNTSNYYVISS